ncbi:hypothetical protein GCM10027563_12010 [Parasphingorhabdus pacifica]
MIGRRKSHASEPGRGIAYGQGIAPGQAHATGHGWMAGAFESSWHRITNGGDTPVADCGHELRGPVHRRLDTPPPDDGRELCAGCVHALAFSPDADDEHHTLFEHAVRDLRSHRAFPNEHHLGPPTRAATHHPNPHRRQPTGTGATRPSSNRTGRHRATTPGGRLRLRKRKSIDQRR